METIHVLIFFISISVATVLDVTKTDSTLVYKSLVFGDEFLAQGLHLVTPEVFSWD